ncbi:MAG: ATP-binding cassette domain-containing protein [Phycisphaerae bacterium]|nr:ATP-binding cassette domain-containing protein [Phycisphaerae bacterium]
MGNSVVRALDGVDLTIERGEFLAITGASGSGKSTIMHLLGCLDRPTGGTYLLDGRDVGDLSDRELAAARNKQIGFVFQTFNLINRTTAWENVAVPLFYARQTGTRGPALRALEHVGLAERAGHQPSELSGGERQRVAIARAIVNDPVLVMADEPTGNLDTRTGLQIMEIFHKLNEQGVTIIMVTHEHEIAEQTQRIILMRDGKIVSDRPTRDILAEEERPARKRPLPPEEPLPPAVPIEDEETAQTSPPVEFKPRMMRGATAGFVCGLSAVILMALAFGMQIVLGVFYAEEMKPSATPLRPPMPVMIGGLGVCVGFLGTIVLGILAIVFSLGARKRIRTEPGNWLGRRRALAGIILGGIAIAVPVVVMVVGIIVTVVKKTA